MYYNANKNHMQLPRGALAGRTFLRQQKKCLQPMHSECTEEGALLRFVFSFSSFILLVRAWGDFQTERRGRTLIQPLF
jgi:hypothetical protein